MNHIYRSIFNKKTGAFSAVSELVSTAGKSATPGSSARRARFVLKALAASLLCAFGPGALALPTGAVVVAGNATVQQSQGATTIVQGSQNAVLNWNTFNIGSGEAVRFVQPDSNSVALNRVLDANPSSILGTLTANGKVFLVNPNGILFGKGASVNVGGLAASTLAISTDDFMAGSYRFSNAGSGAVSNLGSINAPGGYVALLGAQVSNQGTISARLGAVALAGGKAVTLDVAGDGLLKVTVDQGVVNALVSNGGMIEADGGTVIMTTQAAGTLLNTVVNNTGVVQAHRIEQRGGTIVLLGDMASGTLHASGTLDASAPAGGDGGFVETSAAHVRMAPELKVSTAAGSGASGTWLIDPTDFNIAVSGGDMTGSALSAALGLGNVQIQSLAGSGGAAGDINVNDTVSWSANKLTLTAQNNINVNRPMRGSGSASLALEYGQSAVSAGNLRTYNVAAAIDLPSGDTFSTRLGSNGALTTYKVINDLGAANSITTTDLQGINGGLYGNYALGSNIDASATSGWNGGAGFSPIGIGTPSTLSFYGNFDGLGHVINKLSINRTASIVGLFGRVTGTISNVGVVGGSVTGGAASGSNTGMLIGYNFGTLRNSFASGTVTAAGGAAGGLVGRNQYNIVDSYSSVNVSSTASDIGTGGLAGRHQNGSIRNSFATGTVSSGLRSNAGGLVGLSLGSIANSFATGAVSGRDHIGGLVGELSGATITTSHATGPVTAGDAAGGLVGYSHNIGIISNSYATSTVTGSTANAQTGGVIGGLVGLNGSYSQITDSYATGNVTGTTEVGGLIGRNDTWGMGLVARTYASGVVTGTAQVGGVSGANSQLNGIVDSYFNASANPALSGIGYNYGDGTGNPTGLTSVQMKAPSSFAGFTFDTSAGTSGNHWVLVNTDGTFNGSDGATLPMLASEWSSTIRSAHQLQLMGLNLAGKYIMARDIDASATASSTLDVWTGGSFIPVGGASQFAGSLNGAFHTISGLTINRPGLANSGLFGTLGAGGAISNLGMEGGAIAGGSDSGAIAGASHGAISNVYSTVAVNGGDRVGALVGAILGGSVSDSYASGAVTGSGSAVGGLAGVNDGAISNSYAAGPVSGALLTGGLAGTGSGSASGSFWNTTTSGQASSAGGSAVGMSTAGMQSVASFGSATVANGGANPHWDLTRTWVVYDGIGAPLLRGFMTPLLVRIANASKTYDGQASAVGAATYSNLVNGDLQGSLAYAGGGVTAGVHSAGGLYSNGGQHGYAIEYDGGSLTVNQRAISLTGAAAATRVYDGTTSATLSGTLAGVLAGDTGNVGASLGGTFADKHAGNGKVVTPGVTLTGSASANYSLNPVGPLTATITAAPITQVSGISASDKAYDSTTAATINTSAATFAGIVGTDVLAVNATAATFSDQHAGAGKTVTISGLILGGADAANYTLQNTVATSTATISARPLTIAGMAALAKTYDASAGATLSGGSLSGLQGGESLGFSATGVFADQNAGIGKSVTVTGVALVDGTGAASNYTVISPSGITGDITQKALSVTGASVVSKTYDGTTAAALSGASLTGLVGGDTLALSGLQGVYVDRNAGVGKQVTVSGAALADGSGLAANYTVSNPVGITGDITARAVTISGVTAADKMYDGTATASLSGGVLSGMAGIETLGLTNLSGAFTQVNAGTGASVTVSGATLTDGTGLASNYSVSNPLGVTANITPKALTLSGMTALDKVYDGNTAASLAGGTLAGLIGSETLGWGGQTGIFDNPNAGIGKGVSIQGIALSDGSGLASNYTVANPAGVMASISAKALSLTGMAADSKIYDGTASATLRGGALNGMVLGETLTFSGASATFADRNAGVGKAVAVSGATLSNGSGLASNYSLANPTGLSADITARQLTVAGMSAASKIYDANTAATLSGGNLLGLQGGDTLSFSGHAGAFSDPNAAPGKMVTVTGLTLGDLGGLASNYTVSNPIALVADITPRALTVSGMRANGKAYDATSAAALAGGTLLGLQGGDTLGFSGHAGAFSDTNAAAGKMVTVTGIRLSDLNGLASNYTLSNPTGLLADITPRALTVSGMSALSKTYDATTSVSLSGGTLLGLQGGETLSFSGHAGAFSDANAGRGKAVDVTGMMLGDLTGLARNYTVSNPAGLQADISARTLTVSGMSAYNKVYDATAAATLSGGTLMGLQGGDTLSFSGHTGAFTDANAASGKSVVVTGITLGNAGGLASNYTVSNPAGLQADITARALTIAGMRADNKTYDGTTVAALSGGTLLGLQGGDTLGFSGHAGAFGDASAAIGKTVAVSGVTLTNLEGLASNYTVSNPTGLHADIGRRTLAVSGLQASDKVYDGATAATLDGAALLGLVAGETLAFSATGHFVDKQAGSDKAVAISSMAIADTPAGLAANYVLGAAPANLRASISKAVLSGVAGIRADNKVYDGTTGATLNSAAATFGGLLAGDQIRVTGANGTFSDQHAAVGKTVAVSAIVLGGADAGNYSYNGTARTHADILKAPLSVTVSDSTRRTGAPNPAFDATYVGLVGGDNAASALSGSLVFNTSAAVDSVPGPYAVSAAGIVARNYALSFNDGVLTVDGALPVPPLEAAMAIASIVPPPHGVQGGGAAIRTDTVRPGAAEPGATPAVRLDGARIVNAFPGLNLAVVDGGMNLPFVASGSALDEDKK